MNAPARTFEAKPAVRQEEPLLIGMVGPPGGGKSLSSLLVAKGIQSVRGGPIILIDTEGGRSRKYSDQVAFEIVEFPPPCRPERFLEAIKAQLSRNPACIIIDSASDEHEGEGGYLEWHDEMVPKMGNNEWAAWAKPKASRKKLISGILHIKTPLIFTFRAREKTQQVNKNGKKEIVNIGWQPVAPLEIVHTLDLTCILPPRANGVPTWKSDKIGEDFIIKLPSYLQPYIAEGKPLSEEMGRNFALWAKGDTASPQRGTETTDAADDPAPLAPTMENSAQAGAGTDRPTDERLAEIDDALALAAQLGLKALQSEWSSLHVKDQRTLKPRLDHVHKLTAQMADA